MESPFSLSGEEVDEPLQEIESTALRSEEPGKSQSEQAVEQGSEKTESGCDPPSPTLWCKEEMIETGDGQAWESRLTEESGCGSLKQPLLSFNSSSL